MACTHEIVNKNLSHLNIVCTNFDWNLNLHACVLKMI